MPPFIYADGLYAGHPFVCCLGSVIGLVALTAPFAYLCNKDLYYIIIIIIIW
jgi:hypothetical protein